MQMRRLLQAFALSALYVMMGGQVRGAQQPDPTWPCIQRKVPTLSLSQVWNGPELPDSAVSWSEESGISALVRELSARRMPLADAENTIVKFANSRSGTERSMELAMLAQGLFDHMNAERASVISGIARYAENQLAMAARLRAEASRLAELRAQPDADANEIITRTEQITLETRIFDDRVQSLTYVCEVPTFIEQRLYSLAKIIAKAMTGG